MNEYYVYIKEVVHSVARVEAESKEEAMSLVSDDIGSYDFKPYDYSDLEIIDAEIM